MIFGIIALIVIVLIVLWGVSAYNGLVTLRNRVKNGWAQIDVQLKQRADLIPNLVETVKGYAAHESQVFTQVTQARASALQAAQSGDVAQRIQAENQLSRAIMNLQAVAEAYPQLQANQNFLDLQAQLKALEEKIAYARQFYNDRGRADQHHRRTVPLRAGGVLPGRRSGPSGSAGQVLSVSIQHFHTKEGER